MTTERHPANKKAGQAAGSQEDRSEVLGPDLLQTPGGWGLRNPVLEGRPGPEVTIVFVAFQLGARLFEFGQYYDVIEESVRLRGIRGGSSTAAAASRSILPLARAPVRRNHLSNDGHG